MNLDNYQTRRARVNDAVRAGMHSFWKTVKNHFPEVKDKGKLKPASEMDACKIMKEVVTNYIFENYLRHK